MLDKIKNLFTFNTSLKRIDSIEKDIKESKELTSELKIITEKYSKSVKELELEKRKFELLFEQSILIKAFLDLDGTIQKVNKKFEESFGYSREEIIGKNILDFMYEEDVKEGKHIPSKFLSGDYTSVIAKIKYKTKNNTTLYTDAYIYPIVDGVNKPFVVGIAEDITKDVELEKIIDDKRTFIKNVVDVVPGAIYVYNIQEKRNIWSNREVFEYLGYTKEELKDFGSSVLSKLFTEKEYKNYIENVYPQYSKLNDNNIFDHQHQFKTKDGKSIWFNVRESVFKRDEYGNVKEILGVMLDINDLKKYEQQIRLNSEILKHANDSIVVTDKDGNIIFTNNKFTENSGYTFEEVENKNPRILKSDKHTDKFYEDLWKTISSGKTWNGTIISKAKNGKLFTENTTITPVGNGSIQYYFAIKVKI